ASRADDPASRRVPARARAPRSQTPSPSSRTTGLAPRSRFGSAPAARAPHCRCSWRSARTAQAIAARWLPRPRQFQTVWVFLQGVIFHLKDVLKEKSRSSADDGGHTRTDILELRQSHFLGFIGDGLIGGAPEDLDDAAGYAV